MTKIEVHSLREPDESRTFERGRTDVVHLEQGVVGLNVLEPGWKWSEHVKPIAGTNSCQSAHLGFCSTGHLKVVQDDGTEAEIGPGDTFSIPPGHDAWVVGDQTCVLYDFTGLEHYAERGAAEEIAASEEQAATLH